MSATLVAEVWCPVCRVYYGTISEQLIREGVYEHVTSPDPLPKYCNQCSGVVVRR